MNQLEKRVCFSNTRFLKNVISDNYEVIINVTHTHSYTHTTVKPVLFSLLHVNSNPPYLKCPLIHDRETNVIQML